MDKSGRCIVGKRRRGHGEGSIYQRADGYWCASVEAGRYPNGKRRRARVVRRYKKDVIAELEQLKRRGAAGVVGVDPTVSEHVTWWIDNIKAGTVKASSLDTYRRKARLWIDAYPIGRLRLRKARVPDVRAWLNALADDIGPSARNDARTLLSGALKYAEGAEMIEKNVVSFVGGAKAGAKADDAMTADEADAVLASAEGDRLEALWHVILKYGMRPAELLALRWDAVDLDAAILAVIESKSESGVRDLPLVAGTNEALQAHWARQEDERLAAAPLWQDSGHVFTTPDGRPLPYRTFNTAWHALMEKAGVSDRRPYASRHTCATLLLESGVPLEVVSAILGHSGLAITADVYSKVRSDLKRRGLEKLG